jgi:uncharacterized membrane protein SpoIIM required for sporulation
MTPLQFEADYGPLWQELEAALDRIQGRKNAGKKATKRDRAAQAAATPKPDAAAGPAPDAARLAALYRRSCEHLALARARSYPIHLIDRLEALTQRAHQAIYRRQSYGLAALRRLVLVDIPQAVRDHRRYMLVAALVFALPTVVMGLLCHQDPGFILSLLDANEVRRFDDMYAGDSDLPIGERRGAGTDWQMFGYYIMNNISVGFQCFASGLFLGVGSLFYLAFNGVLGGAVAGYLTARGHAETFYSFVVTHAAFELTAIVIAGAAGLRIGYALLAPGRLTRLQALRQAAAAAVLLLYGVVGLLVIAAAVEAFWSSARWVAPEVKYGVGAACWALVIAYLGWQGRPGPGTGSGHAR